MRKLVILFGVLVGMVGLFIAYSAQSQPGQAAAAEIHAVIHRF